MLKNCLCHIILSKDADTAGVTMKDDFVPPPGDYCFWATGCESPWLTKSLPSAT